MELQQTGRCSVRLSYAELTHVVEFLFLHNQDFKVTRIDEDADTCVLVLQ